MAKFIKRSDSDGKRKRSSSGKARSEEKKSEPGYKAKRSFTKNKSYRETASSTPPRDRSERGHDRPFKREYKKSDERSPSRGGSGKRDFSEKRKESGTGEKRSFRDKDSKKEFRDNDRPSFRENKSGDRDDRRKSSRDDDRPSFREDKRGDRDERRESRDDRPSFREDRGGREGRRDNDRPSFRDDKREGGDESRRSSRDDDRRSGGSDREVRPARKSSERGEGRSDNNFGKDKFYKKDKRESFEKPYRSSGEREEGEEKKRRFTKPRAGSEDAGRRVNYSELEEGKAFSRGRDRERPDKKETKHAPKKADNPDGLIRLNKYLSNAGIASRREADTLIQSGAVKVNGEVIDQLGYKIKPGDKVTYGDESVKGERKVYMLLNKPKDYITTMDDPQERKTVIDLIKGACKERIYPVGRLDRNTTGLLLLTNDGELTTKLTHPKFGVKKVYHVSLNKGLKPDDFKQIIEGIELEDGPVKVDDLAFVGEGKREVGIEIHSGRNRVVRRLFEHLGYDVLKLDRVVFAGLTKKDLPRGKHRFLTAKEISFLKMIG